MLASRKHFTTFTEVKIFGYRDQTKQRATKPVLHGADHVFLSTACTVRVLRRGVRSMMLMPPALVHARLRLMVWMRTLLASEVLALAGASASADSTTTFIRVFGAKITECGTYGGKAGANIDIETSGGHGL